MAPHDCPPAEEGGARVCCSTDMCNNLRGDQLLLQDNHSTGRLSEHDSKDGNSRGGDRRPWLRAATVAVPIAGGCVLLVLVFMAARMLRADRKRHREWRRRLDTRLIYSDRPPPRSLSCAVLGRPGRPQLQRAFTSVGSIGQPGLYRNVSVALSACSDTSRDKYFVFDL